MNAGLCRSPGPTFTAGSDFGDYWKRAGGAHGRFDLVLTDDPRMGMTSGQGEILAAILAWSSVDVPSEVGGIQLLLVLGAERSVKVGLVESASRIFCI